MTAAEKWDFIGEEEYLEGELASEVKHEYRSGVVYAMAGAKVAHNRVTSNVCGNLFGQLRGDPCEVFNSDMKVRIQNVDDVRYYYPDGMVVCHSKDDDASFQEAPVLLFEVLSESTRRVDEGEKLEVYRTIPSLRTYLIFDPLEPAVQVWQRGEGDGWEKSIVVGDAGKISLPEIEGELALADIYPASAD